jgi:hypothetical protein
MIPIKEVISVLAAKAYSLGLRGLIDFMETTCYLDQKAA